MGYASDFFAPTSVSSEESESVSESAGSSRSAAESTSRPADFTLSQLALQGLSQTQGRMQLQSLLDAISLKQQLQAPTPLQQLGLQQAAQSTTGATQQQALLDQLLQDEVLRIQRGAAPTAGQRDLIGRITDERIAAGTSDINAALQESLGLLRSELAPSRGLRPEDTPIQDRGQKLARESLRLTENLVNRARAQEAQQLLEFPLQASALQSRQAQALQNAGIARGAQSLDMQKFQDLLRSQGFARQLALAQLGPTNIGQFTPPGTESQSVSQSASDEFAKAASAGSATRREAGPGASLLENFLGEFIGGLGSLIGTGKTSGTNQPPKQGGSVFDTSVLLGDLKNDDGSDWTIGGIFGDLGNIFGSF